MVASVTGVAAEGKLASNLHLRVATQKMSDQRLFELEHNFPRPIFEAQAANIWMA